MYTLKIKCNSKIIDSFPVLVLSTGVYAGSLSEVKIETWSDAMNFAMRDYRCDYSYYDTVEEMWKTFLEYADEDDKKTTKEGLVAAVGAEKIGELSDIDVYVVDDDGDVIKEY